MKVKAKIDCVGIGYDLKAGEEAELNLEIAEILVRFDYVEEIKEAEKAKEAPTVKTPKKR